MSELLTIFENHFSKLHGRSVSLVTSLSDSQLYEKPLPDDASKGMLSCGEHILRSAAAVEQTFGGIATRLWDDPFEWALPEKLSTTELVIEYLSEVESTRRHAFGYFKSDDDLAKQIPAPEKIRPITDLLVETLIRSSHFQGRAFGVFEMISGSPPPRI